MPETDPPSSPPEIARLFDLILKHIIDQSCLLATSLGPGYIVSIVTNNDHKPLKKHFDVHSDLAQIQQLSYSDSMPLAVKVLPSSQKNSGQRSPVIKIFKDPETGKITTYRAQEVSPATGKHIDQIHTALHDLETATEHPEAIDDLGLIHHYLPVEDHPKTAPPEQDDQDSGPDYILMGLQYLQSLLPASTRPPAEPARENATPTPPIL